MRLLSPRIPGMRRRISPVVRKRRRVEVRKGTWTKKGSKSYFGYKFHTKMDMEHGLIRELETTTASTHDSQVDLSKKTKKYVLKLKKWVEGYWRITNKITKTLSLKTRDNTSY
ncbi:MAG: hypothetical protein AEth_01797 [Candidatus Argoarchaeum ethanivorans]|uniref:Transposase IS4-like domain-containing protein n=1 Tax=Candidatus Argoarchaeum ethanivorans TaxID=2608793 RepID=A0A8B3RZ45_9EURY|nr:MAG: hypothetical protein AEth_01797 [Candidatus Argoarchaeum ethanivorans]